MNTEWIKSEERLPETIPHTFLEYSRDVLLYLHYDQYQGYRIAYLCFKPGNSPDSGYNWIIDSDFFSIEDTYWMSLPNGPV